MAFLCPSCERPIANRRRPTCEFCGEKIPVELLMNAKQLGAIDKIKQDEERRRKLKKLSEKPINDGGGGFDGGVN